MLVLTNQRRDLIFSLVYMLLLLFLCKRVIQFVSETFSKEMTYNFYYRISLSVLGVRVRHCVLIQSPNPPLILHPAIILNLTSPPSLYPASPHTITLIPLSPSPHPSSTHPSSFIFLYPTLLILYVILPLSIRAIPITTYLVSAFHGCTTKKWVQKKKTRHNVRLKLNQILLY